MKKNNETATSVMDVNCFPSYAVSLYFFKVEPGSLKLIETNVILYSS